MLLFGDMLLSRGVTQGLPHALAFRITSFDVGPVDSVSHRLYDVRSAVVYMCSSPG